ncbi:restriction endonuclease subunit S [Marinobacter lutaoensis]|uniref:restriction endonuclease subunit S n=1 Tax=Marinobacter lutaoensis TaxID=135739 RepID=UPI001593621D|nr:restriction endonuclease subunit S [Marinobacter lutaoensis]NVD36299.1 restriction endonuclease subunit S [Marinobacter lutaoensis]
MKTSVHDLLEKHFETAFAAPDGIAKLRELILTLAMQGKLVAQDPNDPPASELLKDIEAEKQRLIQEGKIKKPKPLPPIKPEEVPYELPKGWEWVRLGTICSYIQRGKSPKYADFSSHRVISQKCVRWHGLDIEHARYIDPSSLAKYDPIRYLRVGDLLWNSTGTGTIGRACLVPAELEDVEIVADSHVTVVRPIRLSPVFLWRWIQSPIVQNEIEGSASGTTNQIELNTSTVINHLMPLPPLPEQHRIVARIDQLMARCDALEKLHKEREEKRRSVHAAAIRQLLDAPNKSADSAADSAWSFLKQHFGELYSVKENVAELRKAILQLAVMGRLVPQDPNDPPASELLKEIEAEKQRLIKEGKIKKPKPLPPIKPEEVPYELPQGWEWVRLGDVGLVGSSSRVHQRDWKDQGVPFYRAREIVKLSKLGFVDNELYISEDHYQALAKDGLVPEVNDVMLTGVGTIGVPYIVKETDRFYFKDASVLIFKNYYRLYAPYLYWFFKSPYWIDRIHDGSMGTTVHTLTIGRANDIVVPLPPLPEQHRIVEHIDQLMDLCDRLEQQIDAATGKQTELLNAVMVQV